MKWWYIYCGSRNFSIKNVPSHIVSILIYQLNFVRLTMPDAGEAGFKTALDKLCRIVPSTSSRIDAGQQGILLSGNLQSASTDESSTQPRLLPSLKLIIQFAREFSLPVEQYLLKHLDALFASATESSSHNAIPTFTVPSSVDSKRSVDNNHLTHARKSAAYQ